MTLTNSTASGNNTLGYGGRILATNTVTLTWSTVSGNSTSGEGGGIWNYDDPVTISRSIVAGNAAGGGNPELNPRIGTLHGDYSLIGDTSGLTAGQLADINAGKGNLLDVDRLLGPLANNGGFTLPDGSTILTHALVPGSPELVTGFRPCIRGDAR